MPALATDDSNYVKTRPKTMLELTFAYHFVFEARRALPNKLE